MFTDWIDLGWFQVSVALSSLIAFFIPFFSLFGDAEWPYKRRSFSAGVPVGCVAVGLFYMIFTGVWSAYTMLLVTVPSVLPVIVIIYVLGLGQRLGRWDVAWRMQQHYPANWVRALCGAITSYAVLGWLVYYANSAMI